MKMTRLLAVLIPFVGVQACSDNGTVDIGNDGVTGANLIDYVDNWDGYTEAQALVFGSDRVRLKLTGDGQGMVVLGEDQTYPPATDPNLGYPTNEDVMSSIIKPSMFRGGFAYPVHGVKVEARRIRFTVSTNDFYKTWCELQTPVDSGQDGVYSCAPNGYSRGPDGTCVSADTAAGPGGPINCGKAALCTGPQICACTATSCTSNRDISTQFDAALREQGTLLEGTFNSVTVRMQRQ